MGRTAYFARRIGLSYAIIDLPMTIVGQALFLSASLGEDAVWLLGDPNPVGDRVPLLPPSELQRSAHHYDVVINVDSLTELGRETALGYIRFIDTHAGIFISINHEANDFSVNELAAHFSGLTPLVRTRYWLRSGYVEEIFVTRPKSSYGGAADVVLRAS